MAVKLGKTPAELVFITDPYTAYCINEAVIHFGSTVESAMDAVKTKGKKAAQIRGARENVLRRYVGLAPKFADIRTLRGSEARATEQAQERPDPNFKME